MCSDNGEATMPDESLKHDISDLEAESEMAFVEGDDEQDLVEARSSAVNRPQDSAKLRMTETYHGTVEQVAGDQVVVVYDIDDDLVEHHYHRSQFIDGQLPKVGDRLTVHVHVTDASPSADEEDQVEPTDWHDSDDDRGRKTITGHIEF